MPAVLDRPTTEITAPTVDPRLDKLATLIEQGAKLRPQGQGSLFVEVRGTIFSCAIGAAAERLGLTPERYWSHLRVLPLGKDPYKWVFEACGLTIDTRVADDGEDIGHLVDLIWVRNDTCAWTREQIASWLRALTVLEV